MLILLYQKKSIKIKRNINKTYSYFPIFFFKLEKESRILASRHPTEDRF